MGDTRRPVEWRRASSFTTARAALAALAGVAALVAPAAVALAAGPQFFPTSAGLTLQQEPESIYAPPQPAREDEGLNEGGVHTDLTVRYMSDYVYRGIDYSEV